MPFSSFIQRLRERSSANVPDVAALSSADIEVARVRARRRLVGMVVLVGAGVIGLPWLFETQPRPLSTDVQVTSAVAPRGNAGPAPAIVAVTEPQAPDEKPAPQAIQEEAAPASASKPVVRSAQAPAAASKPVPVAKPATPSRETAKPTSTVAAVASNTAASKEAARARALLDDKSAAKPAPKPVAATAEAKPTAKPAASKPDADTRYVVQIGAYSDVPAAREVRMKAERLGVKTYTQVVDTPAGKKIRVRLGPYASKAEADKAMDALRKAGLTGAVLTL